MDDQYILPFLVFFPMVGGLISYLIGRKNKEARNFFAMAVTGIIFVGTLFLYDKNASFTLAGFCGLGINFECDGLRLILSVLTSFVWLMTTVFSRAYFAHDKNRNRYYFFMQMTLGATLGVLLSADLYTTFIFFEIMSFTSYVLVMHDESEKAIRAAQTYLGVAVIGGLVTLMGLFMMYHMAGTLDISELAGFINTVENKKPVYAVGSFILFGFGAKAGMFPLHIWLPESYTEAPAPATALLSCILSKSGIFGVLVLSCAIFLHDAQWGMFVLILGVITMVLGAVLAVFSINFKRTLAGSSLSQIGFILVAIGMQGILGHHNALAAGGTMLHITNHSLLKLVLFICAGVIYMNTHKLDLNEIRGYGKDKPLLKIIFLMGALGITGIPLWNGYISKTLIHESIVEQIHILAEMGASTGFFKMVEMLFLFSGGLTCAYMAKIFIAVFMEKPKRNFQGNGGKYMDKLSVFVLTISAVILPILGFFPHQTMDKIADISRPFMGAEANLHLIHYFAWANLKGAVISVVVGAIVYFGFIRTVLMVENKQGEKVYVDRWPDWISLENGLYRPLLLIVFPFIGAFFARVTGSFSDGIILIFKKYIFNKEHGTVIPKEDAYFSVYTQDAGEGSGFREGLATSLLFFGIGVTIAMLYMIL